MAREIYYKPGSLKALGMALAKVPCKNLAMTSLDTQKCPCSSFPPSPVPWGEEPLVTPLNFKDPWRHAAHLKFIKCKRHSFQELPCQNWMPQILTRLGLGSKSGLLQTQKQHQVFPHQNFCIWIPVMNFKQLMLPNVSCSVILLQAHFTSHHPIYVKNLCFQKSMATIQFMQFSPLSVGTTLSPCPSTSSASTARFWVRIIPVIHPLCMWHSLLDKPDLALWSPPSPSCNVTFH